MVIIPLIWIQQLLLISNHWTQKKTTIYADKNPGPGIKIWQGLYWNPNPPHVHNLISMAIYKQTIADLHRFASTQNEYYHKNDNINMDSTISGSVNTLTS